jgi:hypothetical protein
MKSTTVLFVAISLTLLVATVAVAIPSEVQAAKHFTWCYQNTAGVQCGFDSKGECKKTQAEDPTATDRPCGKGRVL